MDTTQYILAYPWPHRPFPLPFRPHLACGGSAPCGLPWRWGGRSSATQLTASSMSPASPPSPGGGAQVHSNRRQPAPPANTHLGEQLARDLQFRADLQVPVEAGRLLFGSGVNDAHHLQRFTTGGVGGRVPATAPPTGTITICSITTEEGPIGAETPCCQNKNLVPVDHTQISPPVQQQGPSAGSPEGEQLPLHLAHHTLKEPLSVHLTLGLLTTHTTRRMASVVAMVTIITTSRTILNIRTAEGWRAMTRSTSYT